MRDSGHVRGWARYPSVRTAAGRGGCPSSQVHREGGTSVVVQAVLMAVARGPACGDRLERLDRLGCRRRNPEGGAAVPGGVGSPVAPPTCRRPLGDSAPVRGAVGARRVGGGGAGAERMRIPPSARATRAWGRGSGGQWERRSLRVISWRKGMRMGVMCPCRRQCQRPRRQAAWGCVRAGGVGRRRCCRSWSTASAGVLAPASALVPAPDPVPDRDTAYASVRDKYQHFLISQWMSGHIG